MPTWLLGPWGYVILAVVTLGIGAGAAGWTTHKVDQSFYDELVIKDKDAQIAAVNLAIANQKNQDELNKDAAVKEAAAQQSIEDKSHVIVQKIPTLVSDTSTCITFGLLRVLNAAAANGDVASLTGSQSDDACAGVSWRSFASDLADDYRIGNKNSEQLNALIAAEINLHDNAQKSLDAANKATPSWWQRNFGALTP
jgi:hypothetical protein